MTKKIIILLCIPFLLIGQEYKSEISLQSNIEIESSSFDNSFLQKLLFTGYITDSIKEDLLNSLDENNIINSQIKNTLKYTYNFKNNKLIFSISDINLINMNLKKDLIHLGFEGNFGYQDKTLNFSNTYIRADRFQQFKIVYGSLINNIGLSFGCSYLLGNHHFNYIINKGSLYTAPYGNYLNLEYDINTFMSDTSNITPFANNGQGIAVDFSTLFKIKTYELNLSVEDLGYIIWGSSSMTLGVDSTFTFSGIEIADIYNFNDSILETSNIIDDFNDTKKKSFKSYIPATINFAISNNLNNKYLNYYRAGVIAKWQPLIDNTSLSFEKIKQGIDESNFKPLYYFNSIFKIKKYELIPSISYGGYTNNYNFGFAISIGNKNKLLIGANHLEGLINYENAQAISLQLNIKLQF